MNTTKIDSLIRKTVSNVAGHYDGNALAVSLAMQFVVRASKHKNEKDAAVSIRVALTYLQEAGINLTEKT